MSDSEYFSDYSLSDDSEINNSTITLLNNHTDGKYSRKNYTLYYFQNGREFIENIKPWTFNNPLNTEHINKLYKQLKEEPILTGVFSVNGLIHYYKNLSKNL